MGGALELAETGTRAEGECLPASVEGECLPASVDRGDGACFQLRLPAATGFDDERRT